MCEFRRLCGFILVAILSCAGLGARAQSTPASVDCVQQPPFGGSCSTWIRNITTFTAGNYLTVGGFYAQNDSGGGLFQAGSDDSCAPISITGNTAADSNTISSVSSTMGISPGMSVISSSGNILAYDIITAVDSAGGTITLQTPASFSNSGGALTISNDNGGSVIADAETMPRCFYRSSSQYTPKEWGAYENAGAHHTDDTVALQSWLNTGQSFITGVNHSLVAVAGTSAQSAISIVSFPLICPANTTVQGPTNLTGASSTPLFTIEANSTSGVFPRSSAVIDAYDYCRLSGIAINGNGVADAVDVYGQRVAIDGFSSLTGGSPYDLDCPGSGARGSSNGLKIKDSIVSNASTIDIYITRGCNNSRIIGDVISDAGTTGIALNAVEGTIADGVVEESTRAGIDLTGASRVSVVGMHIEANGHGTNAGAGSGAAIVISGSKTISVCGNHLEGNGGDAYDPAASIYSSQIYFSGTSDNIDFCANVYEPQNEGLADVALRPLYVYDAAPGTVLTNTHLHESPAPQASGQVYSPNAAMILPQLQVPHVPLNEINGLALANDATTPATQVDVQPGEGSDSTNSVTIQLPSACPDNLVNSGQQGLDTGSITASTTYFFFAISSASGGYPSCIASTSTTPSFVNTTGTGMLPSPYLQTYSGLTFAGVPYLYNLPTAAGVLLGQPVQCSCITSGTATVTSAGTVTTYATAPVNPGATTIAFSGSLPADIAPSMAISDSGNGSNTACMPGALIQSGTVITTINSMTNTIGISPGTGSGTAVPNDCLTVSGGYAVGLSTAPSSTGTATATIYNGLYRLVGALYTDATSDVVEFAQDGDTFYLDQSKPDINMAPVLTTAIRYNLNSIPLGIVVEAMGRCVASQKVHIFNPSLAPGIPNSFPLPPGFDTDALAPDTAFPYRTYTNASRQISAQAGASGTMDCMTDGWVLHRSGGVHRN